MSAIRKLFFPVDFSPACQAAGRYVEAMAQRFQASIILFHVVGSGMHSLASDLLPLRRAQLKAFLADELRDFSVERVCEAGEDAAASICCAISERKPDLVMLPTHGLGTFRRLLVGSVTAKILHDVECPVWTGVHAEAAPPLESIRCRKLLCATDLAATSPRVFEWAQRLAREYAAELGVIHVLPNDPAKRLEGNLEVNLRLFATLQTRKRIQEMQAAMGIQGRIFVESGNPAEAIARVASDFNADLIVAGRPRSSRLADDLASHTYAIVRQSPCPVLSV